MPVSAKTKAAFAIAWGLHIAWVILLASVPPVSRDAMTHHLAVPRLWIERGLLAELPEISFSYYPQLLDVLYMLPLYAGVDFAAKYLHFAFALMTAGLIYLFVRRRIGAAWGALAGLMFLTIPVILKLSVTVYVDLGLIFFSAGALFAMVLWLEDTRRYKWLLIAAVCSGLALSTKYSALISFFVMSLALPLFFLKDSGDGVRAQANAVKFGALFVLVSLLVFSPWMIRNASLTGNPMYPLLQGVFGHRVTDAANVDSDAVVHASVVVDEQLRNQPKSMSPLLIRRLVYEESLPYTLFIPVRIFYEGQDNDPKYFDGRLNLLLLLLPLALLFTTRQIRFEQKELPLFAAYVVLVVMLTFLTKDMRARWISAIIPPLVVLSVYSLYLLNELMAKRYPVKNAVHPATIVIVALYFLPNLFYSLDLYRKIDPLPVVSGQVSRDAYISERRPEYAVISAANDAVPDDGKVLGLFIGKRRYFFDVDAIVLNEVFTSIAENAASAADIAGRLRALGYTHIVTNNHLFGEWMNRTDEATRRRVGNFATQHVNELHAVGTYGLYEIID